MADINLKWPENAPGKFYVDQKCISCGACWRKDPEHFKSHDIHTYAYIQHQPKENLELELCHEVRNICPVEAIGYVLP